MHSISNRHSEDNAVQAERTHERGLLHQQHHVGFVAEGTDAKLHVDFSLSSARRV